MAAKKRSATSATPRKKLVRGKYRGLYVRVTRRAKTKAKQTLEPGQIILAIGDPEADAWVPVLVQGRADHVQQADVERIVSGRANAKATSAQQVARARLVKRSRVKVSGKEAELIRSQWRR